MNELIAGLNLLICGAIGFICICRLDKMHGRVLLRVKIQYVLLIVIVAAYGLQPLLHFWPSWLDVIMMAVILHNMAADGYQWRNDSPPESAVTKPGDI